MYLMQCLVPFHCGSNESIELISQKNVCTALTLVQYVKSHKLVNFYCCPQAKEATSDRRNTSEEVQ